MARSLKKRISDRQFKINVTGTDEKNIATERIKSAYVTKENKTIAEETFQRKENHEKSYFQSCFVTLKLI